MKYFIPIILLTCSLNVFASEERDIYVQFMNKCFSHGKAICEKNIWGESKLKKQFLAYSEFIYLSNKLKEVTEKQYGKAFVKELSKYVYFNPSKPDGSKLEFERIEQDEIRGKYNGINDVYMIRKGNKWLLDAKNSELLNYINFEGEETDIIFFFVGLYRSILERIDNENPTKKSLSLQSSLAYSSYFIKSSTDLKQVKELAGISGFTLEQIKDNYINLGR
jgi:hypothetical protein